MKQKTKQKSKEATKALTKPTIKQQQSTHGITENDYIPLWRCYMLLNQSKD
jgi:hypothetical protein